MRRKAVLHPGYLLYFCFSWFGCAPVLLNAQAVAPDLSPTFTPTVIFSPTPTATPTPAGPEVLPSLTSSPLPLGAPTPTVTPTFTLTFSPTVTFTPTITPTFTDTFTPTLTPTWTSTSTPGIFQFKFPSKPIEGKIGFQWGTTMPADEVSLRVYTSGFRLVQKFAFNSEDGEDQLNDGIHMYLWDGLDEVKRSVPPGNYLCFITVYVGKKKYEAAGQFEVP